MTDPEKADRLDQRFDYEVKAYVKIDAALVTYLMNCSKNHYDGHCRSVGEVSGFLYGWHNRITYMLEQNETSTEVRASFHELDTLAKLSEISMPYGNVKVHFGLRKILHAINDEITNLRELGTPGWKHPPFDLTGLMETDAQDRHHVSG